MSFVHIHLVRAVVILCVVYEVISKVEFTNLKCTSFDPKFNEFCHLKSVNRSFKYLSLKVKLYKTPINNVKVNFALLKRFGGYKPFLYNVTVDACKFLRNPSSNAVIVYLHSPPYLSIRSRSNCG